MEWTVLLRGQENIARLIKAIVVAAAAGHDSRGRRRRCGRRWNSGRTDFDLI